MIPIRARATAATIAQSLTLAVLVAAIAAHPVAAQDDRRCFPETGFCIAGPIRAYWERNGGLAVFGYPIGPERVESVEGVWSGPVQWFERDRLEDHANEGLGVLAGRLGARYLELTGRPWQRGQDEPPAPEGCGIAVETGHTFCEPFLSYWRANGGLLRFGLPLGPPAEERIDGHSYTVQYFERRRLELHPEHAGTPYEVQLGLLGRAVWELERRPPPTSVELDPQLTHLLALSVDETTRNLNIVRVGRLGADPTIVNDSPRPGILPREPLAWSPDGLTVAFIDPGRPRSVLVLSTDGQLQERPVALPPEAALDSVDWSPLGDTLLLGITATSGQPAGMIALLRSDGSTQTLGSGRRPRWAPDGARLVYEVPRPDGLANLVVMRADGGGALQIGVGSGAVWSPDGSRLAFSDPVGELIIVGADGGAPRGLGPGRNPVWSPEGQRLAFDRFGGELVVAYADGADPRVVLRQDGVFVPTAAYSAISWSPDGAQLAFRFTNRSSSEVGVVRLDSGEYFTLSGAFLPPRWETLGYLGFRMWHNAAPADRERGVPASAVGGR